MFFLFQNTEKEDIWAFLTSSQDKLFFIEKRRHVLQKGGRMVTLVKLMFSLRVVLALRECCFRLSKTTKRKWTVTSFVILFEAYLLEIEKNKNDPNTIYTGLNLLD